MFLIKKTRLWISVSSPTTTRPHGDVQLKNDLIGCSSKWAINGRK